MFWYVKEFKEIIAGLTQLGLTKEARATKRFVETLAELGAVPESIHVEASTEAIKEQERYVTFTGKIKTKPEAGMPTAKGKPTARAVFIAHDEEQQSGHEYFTIFSQAACGIALSLPEDAQITVRGYQPQPVTDEEKRQGLHDKLHVFAILNHPNKQHKR